MEFWGLRFVFTILSFEIVFCEIQEPHCSRFHYDEKLLEKMIRTEIKFEEIQNYVQSAIEEMKSTLTSFNQRVEQREKKHSEKIENTVAKTETVLAKVEEARNTSVIPTIVFRSRNMKNLSPALNEVFVFTHVMFNYGNGYDNSTGIFTAPVDGTYLFSTNMCTYTNRYICYSIFVNQDPISKAVDYSTGGHPCSSLDAIVVLKAGDKVCVQTMYSSNRVLEDSLRESAFAGVLLHQ